MKFLLVLFFLAHLVYAQDASSDDECAPDALDNYNMPLRVGSLFIILVTSALGIFTPMIMHRIKPYSPGSIRDWILTVGKFFGTGVILATAFVHMLPDAMENFDSPCLTAGWKTYGAFAGVFCMIASFALQLLEMGAISRLDALRKQKQQSSSSVSSATAEMDSKTLEEGMHNHGHSAGLLENEDQSFRNVGTLMLELGIVMHSIIIGITLANTGEDEFTTLLIALVFHQFFEGVALGTRINALPNTSWVKSLVLALLFIIMTPIGVAIGIGIHSSFNPNSSSSVLASAILDSLSAGILLYNAYISLMALEINHNIQFRQQSFSRKAICFLSMYVGAGLMALIGEWA
ncbi:Zinc/iron permease [Syncephalastrum racemosum]|uniref:Zinc/iron permease n=1 Tax=Syncephalastrum racemosum TaxID=13706 RepID=A0A1X2HSE7_SYNRA|nr:Zinc/iron permease [Syncephalastrum racemosum]